MARTGIYRSIDTTAGVQPSTDETNFRTKHYTYADKIRFINGKPQKIGGWDSVNFNYNKEPNGTIRTVYSDVIRGKEYSLLGSHTNLYSILGATLTNITPLTEDAIAIANSLDNHYDILDLDSMSCIEGSSSITIEDADYERFKAGDKVTISGANAFGGLDVGDINGTFIIRTIGIGSYTINVGVEATSTASGGGNAIVRASGLIRITNNSHNQLNDSRIKIEDSDDVGGVLAAEINIEHLIRNVDTNTFDIMTSGTATSQITAGGGADVVYYKQLSEGRLNQGVIRGYGAGLYGAGLYGTSRVSTSSNISYPRIWYLDRYANTIVCTAGNQTPLYQWFGDNSIAPEKITGAPEEINYCFESDNILVTFGASDLGVEVENRIFASDQNNIENWTSSSTNQVFDDDIEGADRLLSHAPINDYNLIFTKHQTYTFRYIGLPFVWEIKNLDENIGIIAPLARVSIKGTVYWMGNGNFYKFNGGSIEVIPSNTQNESTCLDYVFKNLNYGQSSKIHAWYNKEYAEVWFHYASEGSNECDRVVVVNILDNTWTIHNLKRTASQQGILGKVPLLANVNSVYRHEIGFNDDGEAMKFELSTNRRYISKESFNLNNIIPDSIQVGNINFNYQGFAYPQSTLPLIDKTEIITGQTEYIPVVASARFYKFTVYGEELEQNWRMGDWLEEIQQGAPQ
jgi:hypothetical protein